jgi:hypothetical protein
VLISVLEAVFPLRAIERLEGLGQVKKSNDLIGNQTRDLPACSIVSQLTTLLRVPIGIVHSKEITRKKKRCLFFED